MQSNGLSSVSSRSTDESCCGCSTRLAIEAMHSAVDKWSGDGGGVRIPNLPGWKVSFGILSSVAGLSCIRIIRSGYCLSCLFFKSISRAYFQVPSRTRILIYCWYCCLQNRQSFSLLLARVLHLVLDTIGTKAPSRLLWYPWFVSAKFFTRCYRKQITHAKVLIMNNDQDNEELLDGKLPSSNPDPNPNTPDRSSHGSHGDIIGFRRERSPTSSFTFMEDAAANSGTESSRDDSSSTNTLYMVLLSPLHR